MKKGLFTVVVFGIAFAISYIGLCYVPSLRIKLAADPMTYLFRSIHHMVFLKSVLSAMIGAAMAGIAFWIMKKRAC